MSEKDALFKDPARTGPFVFDDEMAKVFPDMLARSIPGYAALLDLIAALAAQIVTPSCRVYDLGCSLGAVSFAVLSGAAERNVEIVAVDSSAAMIARLQQRLDATSTKIELRCQDVLDTEIERATLVVLNFTLQFVPLERKNELIMRIFRGLEPGGVLVLSEKTHAESEGEQLLADLHDGFRRLHGYSDLEMARKRKALEQVLITETRGEHAARLAQAGFRPVEWFRGLGFVSWLAIKAG